MQLNASGCGLIATAWAAAAQVPVESTLNCQFSLKAPQPGVGTIAAGNIPGVVRDGGRNEGAADFNLELHLDTDEANAAGVSSGDYAELTSVE